MTKPIVVLKNVRLTLTSRAGPVGILRDVDLEVARGEFLTLLGPSGSGKTTCLMMLAGFETVTHGEIVLDGRPINGVPAYKRDIGVDLDALRQLGPVGTTGSR